MNDLTSLNSPIGRRQLAQKMTTQPAVSSTPAPKPIPAQAKAPKILTVPNESMTINNDYFNSDNPFMDVRNMSNEDINKLRQQAATKQTKITDPNKDIIEILLGLKHKTVDVKIDGVQFTLKSLKSSEVKFALQQTAKATVEDPENFRSQALILMDIKLRTLALSLYQIDNKPVELVLGTNDQDKIVAILYEMDDNVVTELYEAFSNLSKTQPNASAEEIVENLKK
jgi:hypothetical protein